MRDRSCPTRSCWSSTSLQPLQAAGGNPHDLDGLVAVPDQSVPSQCAVPLADLVETPHSGLPRATSSAGLSWTSMWPAEHEANSGTKSEGLPCSAMPQALRRTQASGSASKAISRRVRAVP